ncbi:MAG: DNA polymerase III subunit gamma/tau, partial [Marinicella sp.]
MTYQVLARKYRPQNFQEIVGQEHVVQALVNGLENNRLHHAFLFTGTRGVGKTTLARVLAKALNCLEGISGNPCGICQHCQEIKNGEFIDLIEVDAASRTGVDDTRSLLENVQYAPNKGQYKIYLIDEVHMFSKSSFNALLKTLEEPPDHVKFLLATTEPEKLPVTVLSRCLQFNLKRLTQKQIGDHLMSLLTKESVQFDEQAIQLISRVADGSMRDALSLMDQSLAFGAGKIQYDEIRSMLGTIEQSHVTELLKLIAAGKEVEVVEKLEWLHAMSVDYAQLLEDFCLLLHEVSLVQSLGRVTGGSHFENSKLKVFAQEITAENIQWYYQLVVVALEQLKFTPSKKISFEMAIIRMLAFVHQSPGGKGSSNSKQVQPIVSQNTTTSAQENSRIAEPQLKKANESGSQQVSETSESKQEKEQLQASINQDPVKLIDVANLCTASWPDAFKTMQVKGMARELARNLELLENKEKVITFTVD